MGKYIIELEDKNVWTHGYPDRTLAFDMKIFGTELTPINTGIPLTPYTEPDMEQVREDAFKNGYDAACKDIDIKSKINAAYRKGLEDAWEAARKIADMPYGEEEKVFGSGGWTFVVNHTASEAIEKIRQYEQEKEMDGLRQNIQTIVDQCGYTLDEIASVLQKMRES